MALGLLLAAGVGGSGADLTLVYTAASWSIVAVLWWSHRRTAAAPGWSRWLLRGHVALATTDTFFFHHGVLFAPQPTWGGRLAEGGYFLSLLVIGVGLAGWARAHGADAGGAVDAAMASATIAAWAWVFLMDPIVGDVTLAGAAQASALLYPLLSVVAIGLVTWLVLAPQRLSRGEAAAGVGYVLFFVACVVYGRQAFDGTYRPGGPLDATFVVSYLLIATSLVAVTKADGRATEAGSRRTSKRRRVLLVSASSLVAPAVMAAGSALGFRVHLNDLAIVTLVLFFLATIRLAMLAAEADRSAAALASQGAELEDLVEQLQRSAEDRNRLIEGLTLASESQRAELASRLHDGPIQRMATANLRLDVARMSIASGALESAGAAISVAAAALDQEVHGLRDLMTELRPPALDVGGLSDAIDDCVRAFERRSGIRCVTNLHLSRRLAGADETVLYRVVQNSLSNIAEHAAAGRVTVDLAEAGGVVTVSVTDDGCGFDPAALRALRPGRLGIASLRERVELAGGRLLLESTPGRGTSVTVELPAQNPGEER